MGAEFLVNLEDGQQVDVVRDQVMDVVRSQFRPEFLNRLDETILFQRLQRQDMGKIVDIQIARLTRVAWMTAKLCWNLMMLARDWIAEKGYDPAYGARPLKRVIQRYLQDTLAEMLLGR